MFTIICECDSFVYLARDSKLGPWPTHEEVIAELKARKPHLVDVAFMRDGDNPSERLYTIADPLAAQARREKTEELDLRVSELEAKVP